MFNSVCLQFLKNSFCRCKAWQYKRDSNLSRLYCERDQEKIAKFKTKLMSQEVRIREIEWLSKDAEEALVYLTDGVNECAAFCQPCEKEPGGIIQQPLLAFGAQGIKICDGEVESIQRIGKTFGHVICARVVDADLEILKVGAILLELDTSLPGGIGTNCVVRCICRRIDLLV